MSNVIGGAPAAARSNVASCNTRRSPHSWDSETGLIRPARLAPPLVCVTWQEPGKPAQIVHHTDARPLLESWFRDLSKVHVGANIAFDCAVAIQAFPDLPFRQLVFVAYDDDRITDVLIRQQLIDIAAGIFRGSVTSKGKRFGFKYDLESLAERCAGMHLQKDAWRLSYEEFIDTPLAQWPARARVVQAEARVRLAALRDTLAQHQAIRATDRDDTAIKALEKQIEGLESMVASDTSRCTEYPLDDARAALAVYQAQEKHAHYLHNQYEQARGAFSFYLNSAWGLRTDGPGIEQLRKVIEEQKAEIDLELKELGLVKQDDTRDTKVAKRRMIAVCEREGLVLVRTDSHFADTKAAGEARAKAWASKGPALLAVMKSPEPAKPGAGASKEARATYREMRDAWVAAVKAAKAALKELTSCKTEDGFPCEPESDECVEHVCLDADACDYAGDEVLQHYAQRTTLGKQLSNDIPGLEGGILYPLHTRYGLAATGRSTSSKPNIQNQSKRPGFREAFVPRPGRIFIECDYPQLELYTLAQCCVTWVGFSKLADALNGGLDPHTAMAAQILKRPYEWCVANKKLKEVDNARQTAKVANFGFPGGLGVDSLIAFARKSYKVVLTPEDAKRLKDDWFAAWPEMRLYFERVNKLCEAGGGLANVETLFTRRMRGRATYCAACNNGFQALGADCAKRASYLIARACYAEPASPLFNSRINAFVHDEFIGETDDGPGAHDAAFELARLMRVGANQYLPDVPIPESKMAPVLMRRWYKQAESIFDASGRLVEWDPVLVGMIGAGKALAGRVGAQGAGRVLA